MAEAAPTVAITRSVEDNRSLSARLESLGLDVVAVPLIEVAPASDDGRALGAAIEELAAYDWVVLTSANGVRAMTEAMAGQSHPSEQSWPNGVSVAAVGPATAAAAAAAGLPVDLVPTVATADALAAAFPDPPEGGDRVLAPLAQLAGDTIVDGLGAKGWRVERVEAYRTVAPVDQASTPGLAAGLATAPGVDAVAFFSPSTVDRWVDRFGCAAAVAVCVGPSTAARAEQQGFAQVLTAEPHSEDGVVAALEKLLVDRPLP